jgi:hypothetical protein
VADILGYAASLAVLATFTVRGMVPLRILAILSNVLFIVYGYEAHIHPVLLLHLALLPINFIRLAGLMPGWLRRAPQRELISDRSARIG